MKQELENVIEDSRTSVLVRMKGWQKLDLEEAARAQNRSVNNFILNELSELRKWKDLDPGTGEVIPPQ